MQERPIVLETIVRIVSHTVLIVSLFLLFSGHNAPGGGFAGGLVASCVLILRYISRDDPTHLHFVPPEFLLGAGILLAFLTGVAGWIWGDAFLTMGKLEITVPVFGKVKLLSTLLFDIGVYVTVVGFVLMLLRVLGEETGEVLDRAGDTHEHGSDSEEASR